MIHYLFCEKLSIFIYNLTPEMITESLKECAEKITSYGNDNIEIIKFLQELKFGQDVDISELLKKINILFLKKYYRTNLL